MILQEEEPGMPRVDYDEVSGEIRIEGACYRLQAFEDRIVKAIVHIVSDRVNAHQSTRIVFALGSLASRCWGVLRDLLSSIAEVSKPARRKGLIEILWIRADDEDNWHGGEQFRRGFAEAFGGNFTVTDPRAETRDPFPPPPPPEPDT